jgi:hypothetical protein
MDITITLSEAEIKEALKAYLTDKSPVPIEGDLDLNLIAGKGSMGAGAVIKICEPVEAEIKKPITRKKAAAVAVEELKELVPIVTEAPKEIFVDDTPEVSPGLREAAAEDDVFGAVDPAIINGINCGEQNLDSLFGGGAL